MFYSGFQCFWDLSFSDLRFSDLRFQKMSENKFDKKDFLFVFGFS